MSLVWPSLSMRENVVGLDIGDGLLAAAQVEPLDDGTCSLVGGGWAAIDAAPSDRSLADRLRTFWREHRLSSFTVAVSLRSPALLVRYFRHPKLTQRELEQALRLEAEETLKLDGAAIVVDWQQDGTAPPADTAADRAGILVAAPRADVDRLMGILDHAGLFPVVLETGVTALANSFLALHPAETPVCLVNLMGAQADMAILDRGASLYPRLVVSRNGAWDSAAEYLAGSVRDMLKYHQFKMRHEPVAQVYLTGAIPDDATFLERLRLGTGAAVTVWDPTPNLSVRSWPLLRALRAAPGRAALLATSIGLSLRR